MSKICFPFCSDVCLVAMDPLFTTTACASLSFIGYNTNPPRVEYTPDSVTMFVEGQSEPVMIVSGSIIVTDDDHPTRYIYTVFIAAMSS